MKNYTLFEEAMNAFNKLAKISLKALIPYAKHTGNCSSTCPSCALKDAYWKVSGMTTTIPKPIKAIVRRKAGEGKQDFGTIPRS